jgi:hypothetical protein
MTALNFWNIPAEMRSYANFICWRYEWREGSTKPTKVPYDPKTGEKCDVKDEAQHGTFQQAIQAHAFQKYDGIGFCFTPNNPYSGIDLDDPRQVNEHGKSKFRDPDIQQRIQNGIYERFVSYAELSPSGVGLHIIVKGKIPGGVRRSSIEIYSEARYFTMTGNTVRDVPPAECQELLSALYAEMRENENEQVYDPGTFAFTVSDEELLERATNAANGAFFTDLWEGRWQDHYTSQSEADFALIDILAFYTDNKFQVINLFRKSGLGQRDKANRDSYVSPMVNKSFDMKVPLVDMTGIMNEIAAAHSVGPVTPDVEATADQGEKSGAAVRPLSAPDPFITPHHFRETWPQGMLGELVSYLYHQSPRPVFEVSLMAALGLLSGMAGRAYNVSATGLNNYYLILAPTASGKEAAAQGVNKMIENLAGGNSRDLSFNKFIGPADLASGQGLLKHISLGNYSYLSIIGEFGVRLAMMSDPRASQSERQLLRVLLDLFNKSGRGQVVHPTVYSDQAKNTDPLPSPAVSLLGESTPLTFFEGINEDTVNSGLIPRFTILEYDGPRPHYNKKHSTVGVPHNVTAWLKTLGTNAHFLNDEGKVRDIPADDEAQDRLDKINDDCDDIINNKTRSETARNLWSRVHLKTWKIAALSALSRNISDPVINVYDVEWAMSLVVEGTLKLAARFDLGTVGVGGEDQLRHKALQRAVADWINPKIKDRDLTGNNYNGAHKHFPLRTKGAVPWGYLFRRLAGLKEFKSHPRKAAGGIKATLDIMFGEGVLQPMNKAQIEKDFGLRGDLYVILDPSYFIGE